VAKKRTVNQTEIYDPIAELVRVNPVPSIIVDMQTLSIVVVNESIIQLLGYSEQELVGRSILQFVPAEDITAVQKAADEPPPEAETLWRCLRKDGVMLYLKLKYRETTYQHKTARFIVFLESSLTPFDEHPKTDT
jgi:PAS domain S-box-containing protein